MTVPTTRERGFKLGLLPPTELRRGAGRTFASVLKASAPNPPPQVHYGSRVPANVPWQMDANGPDPEVTIPGVPADWGGCGDCVVAGIAHLILMSNYDEYGFKVAVPSANECVETYCQLSGCTPEQLFTDPNTYDNGLDPASTLDTWNTTGLFGTKIGAYYAVNYTNEKEVSQACAFGGGLLWCWNLPESAETEWPNEWTYVPGSPIIGGHLTTGTGYIGAHQYSATWGVLLTGGISPGFVRNYASALYVVITPQALAAAKGPNPGYGAAALDVAQIEADFPSLDN